MYVYGEKLQFNGVLYICMSGESHMALMLYSFELGVFIEQPTWRTNKGEEEEKVGL